MTVLQRKPWLVWTLVGAGYVALLGVLFWRVFFAGKMAGWDSLEEYWPDLIYQSRAYTSGELPLWNPYTLGGYSFYADPQASMLAPGNWICSLVSPLVGTGPLLMMFKIVLLFYAALWGMHVLVYRWTRCHAAAALAAITFVAGAPVLVHKNGALLWPMLYLPWAMVALDAFLAKPTLRRGALLGFAVGATGAAGHPQGFFFAALVIAAYVLGRAAWDGVAIVRARREQPIGRVVLGRLRTLAPGGVVALALALLWLWAVYGPAGTVVEDSERGQRSLAWILGNPMNAVGLRELFAPNVDTNWAHDIYLGPLAIVLVVWLAAFTWRGRFWFGLAAFATVLAVGAQTFVLPVLVEHVPGFDLFRIPYRYKLITGFACACGVGLATGHLMTAASLVRRDRIAIAVASALWLVGALAFGITQYTLYAALVLAALLALVLDHSRRKLWVALLILLVALDLWRANDSKLAILQPVPDADKGLPILKQLPGLERDFRFWASDRWSSHPGVIPFATSYRHDLREISGFEQPLTPRRVIDLLARAKKTPGVLAHFNVKYYLGRNPGAGVPVAGTTMYSLEDVAPVVRLYASAETVPSAKQLERFASTTPSTQSVALVDAGDAPPPLPSGTFAPVDGRVISLERNRITVEIDAPAAGIVVVNEVWAPEWRATVDGVATPVFRANYMLRGVVVSPGKHRIEMECVAPGYRAAVYILVGLLLAFAVLALLRSRRIDAVLDRVYGPPHGKTPTINA